jgi:hypothetical protein
MFRNARIAMLLLSLATSLMGQARMGSISGRILSPDGTPAVGVRVTAVAAGDLTSAVLTDNAGRYRLEGIPPGKYLIAAGLIGSFTYLPGTTDESKATAVSVTANAVTESADFKLVASAGVRLRGVIAAPTGNFPRPRQATLTGRALTPNEAIEPRDTAVQPDGSFEFRGVLPGNYEVEFGPTPQRIKLTVGSSNLDDIKVPPLAVMRGRVIVEDGGPLLTFPTQAGTTFNELMIATRLADSPNTYHLVPETRTFAFPLASEETYSVEVYGLPFGYYFKSLRSGGKELVAGKLTVGNESEVNVDVILTKQRPATEPAGVTVRGRVTSPRPIPTDLQVTMTMTPALYASAVRLDADGSFVFREVPEGKYTARLIGNGVFLMTGVVVDNADVNDVAFAIPTYVLVRGRLVVENGVLATLPPITIRFERLDGQGTDARRFNTQLSGESFRIELPDGTFRVSLPSLPTRYAVRSMRYGSADARNGFKIDTSKPAEELVVTLTPVE